jgi:hypothetical protein
MALQEAALVLVEVGEGCPNDLVLHARIHLAHDLAQERHVCLRVMK